MIGWLRFNVRAPTKLTWNNNI